MTNIFVSCDECGLDRPMVEAIGMAAEQNLPACRGRHPHLGSYEWCDSPTRTMALSATNSWFAMQLRVFSLPRAERPVDQMVAEFWPTLEPLAGLEPATAKTLMPTHSYQWAWCETWLCRGGGQGWRLVAGCVAEGATSGATGGVAVLVVRFVAGGILAEQAVLRMLCVTRRGHSKHPTRPMGRPGTHG